MWRISSQNGKGQAYFEDSTFVLVEAFRGLSEPNPEHFAKDLLASKCYALDKEPV